MSFTFGRTTTTSAYGTSAANNKYGGKYPLATAGYLQSITAYISAAAGGTAPVRFGCYDANTYALVAYTEATTLPAGTGLAWVTLNVASPPYLPVGDYILCAHAGSNYLDIRRDLTGGISGYVWDLYSDGLNNPWGTWSPGTKNYCIYGTLTVPDPPPPPPTPGPVASSQQMVLYVEADPPSETTLDVLRIYKGNGSTYTDITSSTIQGFADIRKTDVLNGPGSLDFSLAASTVKQLNTWIDENSVVELWSAGVRVGCYYVDEYTPSWATCSATVKCLGALSLAGRVLYDSVNVPITVDDLAMAALVTEVDASNTGTVWRWDEELQQLGSTGVAVAASGNSALDWLATVGPMISGRFWVDADWYFNAAILKDPDVDAVDKTYAMGTNGQDFRTTYSARAIYNYLTVLCPNAEAPGYVICLDETSQGIYGIRAAKTTYSDATTLAMGAAYGDAQLATLAYPQLSVTVLGNHDSAVTSGMLAEVTGLDDGRTYKGIIQQISWRVGDLTDEIIMSAQPLSLNAAVSAGFSPNERLNLTRGTSIPGTFTAYNAAILGLLPKLYWPLTETSGAPVDLSGYGHDASESGSLYSRLGPILGDGAANLAFGYAGASVQYLASHADINPDYNVDFTWTFWCQFTSVANYRVMIDKLIGAAFPYTIVAAITTGIIQFARSDGTHTPVATSAAAANDGRWHFVMCRKSGTKMQVMVDVVLGTEVTDTTNTTTTNAGNFYVGTRDSWAYPYTGDLARVAYFPTALTWEQGRGLYYAGRQIHTLEG